MGKKIPLRFAHAVTGVGWGGGVALKPSAVLFVPFQVRDFPIPPEEAAPSRKESSVIPPATVFFSTLPLPRAHCRAVGRA